MMTPCPSVKLKEEPMNRYIKNMLSPVQVREIRHCERTLRRPKELFLHDPCKEARLTKMRNPALLTESTT
jgi:hypothetical protein